MPWLGVVEVCPLSALSDLGRSSPYHTVLLWLTKSGSDLVISVLLWLREVWKLPNLSS